jgi:hypothetical protein
MVKLIRLVGMLCRDVQRNSEKVVQGAIRNRQATSRSPERGLTDYRYQHGHGLAESNDGRHLLSKQVGHGV